MKTTSKFLAVTLAGIVAAALGAVPAVDGCGYYGFYRATCVVSGPLGAGKECCKAGAANKELDFKITADHNGAKIYFACEACKTKFLQSPEKYIASANYQLAVTWQARQVFCPVTGKSIREGVPCDVEGINIIVANEEIKKVIDGLSPEAKVAHVFSQSTFLDSFAVRGPNMQNAFTSHQAQHRGKNG
jgi:YHS domain-containing protein